MFFTNLILLPQGDHHNIGPGHVRHREGPDPGRAEGAHEAQEEDRRTGQLVNELFVFWRKF